MPLHSRKTARMHGASSRLTKMRILWHALGLVEDNEGADAVSSTVLGRRPQEELRDSSPLVLCHAHCSSV